MARAVSGKAFNGEAVIVVRAVVRALKSLGAAGTPKNTRKTVGPEIESDFP